MTANRALAEERGIDEETCLEIDRIHEQVSACTRAAIDEADSWADSWAEWVLNEYDRKLQALWKFEPNPEYHTLYKKYLFKKQWYGKVFKCKTTGEEFTIPYDVQERDFFSFGEGAFVDCGRLSAYARFGNCERVDNKEP